MVFGILTKSNSVQNRIVLSLFLTAVGFFSTCWAAEIRGVIQADSVKARQQPSFLGPVVMELKYLQEVQIIEHRNAFSLVELNGAKGWVPRSALTTPEKLKLRKGNEVPISKSNPMTAGKGLGDSREVPGKRKGRAADQGVVDRVEAMTPEREGELQLFIRQGELRRGSYGLTQKEK